MIISWMLFATFGIFMARYMKTALKEQKICGKAAWFPVSSIKLGMRLCNPPKISVCTKKIHFTLCHYSKLTYGERIFKKLYEPTWRSLHTGKNIA